MLICDDMTQVTHAGDFTVVKLVGSEFFSHQLTDYRLQTVLDLSPQHIPVCKGRVQSKGGNVEIYTLGSRPPHGSVPKGLLTTMYLSQSERSACHTWRHLQTCPCCHTISREKEGAELAGQGGLSRLSVSGRWCEQNIRELKIFRPSF